MGELMAEARQAFAKLEAIREQLRPTDERMRELLRRGLAMLDGGTTPQEWKDWLWDTHSTLRAHIAALRLAESVGCNPCASRQNARSGHVSAKQRVDLGI